MAAGRPNSFALLKQSLGCTCPWYPDRAYSHGITFWSPCAHSSAYSFHGPYCSRLSVYIVSPLCVLHAFLSICLSACLPASLLTDVDCLECQGLQDSSCPGLQPSWTCLSRSVSARAALSLDFLSAAIIPDCLQKDCQSANC